MCRCGAKVQKLQKERPSKDLNVEAAVIGAGLAGVLIARRLKDKGIQAVVLEADRIGSGQTKNTTAKITSQHGMIYDALIQNFGEVKARQYAQANQQAVEEYEKLIRERNIDCDFRKCSAYLYSKVAADPSEGKRKRRNGWGWTRTLKRKQNCHFPWRARCVLKIRRGFIR